jgi:hypothetical protein
MNRSKNSWVLCILFIVFTQLLTTGSNAQDSLAFGDKKWVDEALMGRIYFLPDTTRSLPVFDTLEIKGTIYSKKIDVPTRNWTSGFPGVPDRKEWFGVVYTGNFKVKKPGNYIFRLTSDDGSKLYIDKKLVIDNDGIHGPNSKLGTVELDDSKHSIRVEYFQGPASQIALQLFATIGNDNEMIFSSDNFSFITPPEKKPMTKFLIYIGAGLLLLLLLFIWFRKKKRMPTA